MRMSGAEIVVEEDAFEDCPAREGLAFVRESRAAFSCGGLLEIDAALRAVLGDTSAGGPRAAISDFPEECGAEDLRRLIEAQRSGVVVGNLPAEIRPADLRALLAQYGPVLLAAVSAPETDDDWRATRTGYALLGREEDARRAVEGADGKFIGPNRIVVAAHRWESRAGDSAEVRATGLPVDWEAEDVAVYFCRKTGMARERVFRSGPRVVPDTRAGRACSKGSMATFTCADPETAERVVEAFINGKEKFETVREPVRVCKRYPRGAEVLVKLVAQDRPVGKFSQSGRNVQVFGLKVNATNGQVRKFFSRYGEIESMRSVKTNRYVRNDTFHYNILFRTTKAASDAIENAAGDEKKINPRLSRDGLVVQLYQEKIRAKPTSEGKQQGHGK